MVTPSSGADPHAALFAGPDGNPARRAGGLACGAPDAPYARRDARAHSAARERHATVDTVTAPPRRLLDRRLVFLLGKGGVGRSTVAAALGPARRAPRPAARSSSRSAARGDVPRLFGARRRAGRRDRARARAVDARRRSAPGAGGVPARPAAAAGARRADRLERAFGYVAAATPGLRELLTIGKIWELAQHAAPPARPRSPTTSSSSTPRRPATGWRCSRRRGPSPTPRRSVRSRARPAIIADDAARPDARPRWSPSRPPSRRPSTSCSSCARALGGELDAVLVNAVAPARFTAADATASARGATRAPSSRRPPAQALAVALADGGAGAREQRAQLARLGARGRAARCSSRPSSARASLEALADRLVARA